MQRSISIGLLAVFTVLVFTVTSTVAPGSGVDGPGSPGYGGGSGGSSAGSSGGDGLGFGGLSPEAGGYVAGMTAAASGSSPPGGFGSFGAAQAAADGFNAASSNPGAQAVAGTTYGTLGHTGYGLAFGGPPGANGSGSFTPGGGNGPIPDPSAPSPALALEAQVSGESGWHNSELRVAPADEVELRWTSTDVTSCSTNFGASGTSGTEVVEPDLGPGESRDYEVTCTGLGGGSFNDVLTVRVPDLVVVRFEAASAIIRANSSTTLEWEVALDASLSHTPDGDMSAYAYECVIEGGTPGFEPYTFNLSTGGGSGSVETAELSNKFNNRLSCGGVTYAETEIEVVSGVQEL